MSTNVIPVSQPKPWPPATKVRYRVLGFMVLMAMVTYLDRACLATLAPHVMRDLNLSKEQMSWVYSVFALGYAAFEIPTAWWADRLGVRRVLTRIVVWWSFFTLATAGAFNFLSLLVARFLFGVGEAGAWPSAARVFSRWATRSERGLAQGIFFAGAHLAAGLTPVIVLALVAMVQWRMVFVIFSLLGFIWAFVWYRWFRDEPAEHQQVNAAELQLIVSGRTVEHADHSLGYWRRLFCHRNTLLLCLMYFPSSCAFYFCITWLPTYLNEKHGLTAAALGFAAGLPLLLSVFGDLFGGFATDWMTKKHGVRIGRCGVGVLGNVIAGLAMCVAAFASSPALAAAMISIAVAASMFTLGAAWSTCLDVGGRHVGVLSAAMNTSGQIGSVLTPLIVTFLLTQFGSWNAPVVAIGGLFFMGATCWLFINPARPVFD